MSRADNVSVSVVIPVRNGHRTVGDAVHSALGAAPVREVVVVDDGSEDETVAAVSAVRDRRVSLVQQPATGVCRARNCGAEKATSTWLVFLDADDQLVDGALELLLGDVLPSTVLACGAVDRQGARVVSPELHGPIVQPLLPGSFAIRRSAFRAVGGYDERLAFAENTDLSIRLLEHEPDPARVVCLTAHPTLRKFEDPERNRPSEYSQKILSSADHFLDRHASVLSAIGATAAYASVGGVAAARLRRWHDARRLFVAALRSPSRRWKDLGRLVAACLPGVRERVWHA